MDKAAQRRLAAARRRAMSAQARAEASRTICQRLIDVIDGQGAILSYLATPDEVDLSELHREIIARGIPLAFPVTGVDGAMEACIPPWPAGLVRGRYGILAPDPACSRRLAPEAVTLVLTPCVAFDAAARRMGHGGGYYDRYFSRCPQALRIGAAFACQELEAIVCTPLDVPLHRVVTERGCFIGQAAENGA